MKPRNPQARIASIWGGVGMLGVVGAALPSVFGMEGMARGARSP